MEISQRRQFVSAGRCYVAAPCSGKAGENTPFAHPNSGTTEYLVGRLTGRGAGSSASGIVFPLALHPKCRVFLPFCHADRKSGRVVLRSDGNGNWGVTQGWLGLIPAVRRGVRRVQKHAEPNPRRVPVCPERCIQPARRDPPGLAPSKSLQPSRQAFPGVDM